MNMIGGGDFYVYADQNQIIRYIIDENVRLKIVFLYYVCNCKRNTIANLEITLLKKLIQFFNKSLLKKKLYICDVKSHLRLTSLFFKLQY